MNHRSINQTVDNARGISLLEVVLAVFILSLCALAMLSAAVTSSTATRQSAEYTAAVTAARKKMEELSATPFASLVSRYGANNPTLGNTFKVYMNEGTEYAGVGGVKTRGVELQGFGKLVNNVTNTDAGEIVIVNSESALPSTYGYSCYRSFSDLYPDFGKPGGISFKSIPIDLDGDGLTTSGDCYNTSVSPIKNSALRLPVGVIIRWDGPHGPERYELWTVMTSYN